MTDYGKPVKLYFPGVDESQWDAMTLPVSRHKPTTSDPQCDDRTLVARLNAGEVDLVFLAAASAKPFVPGVQKRLDIRL